VHRVLMMANLFWPNWIFISYYNKKINLISLQKVVRKFSTSRIKAIYRIGPHDKDVLSVLICGMLGDWWLDRIKGQLADSVIFQIEQGVINTSYIHYLTTFFNERGY
jgi:hypothetical protein